MMNRRWILAVLVLALTLAPAVWAQEDDEFTGDCELVASGAFARVRSEWSLNGEEVARIGENDAQPYQVRGKNASAGYTWYLIFSGWVRSDVVTVSGDDCDEVPVVFTRVDTTFNSDAYPCPADFTAPGSLFLAPRISTGQENIPVLDTDGIFYVYEAPNRESRPLAFVPTGDTLDSIGIGPLCEAGLVWWEVVYNGQTGFAYESRFATGNYTMGPVGAPPPPPAANQPPPAPTQPSPEGADVLPPSNAANTPGVTYNTNELPARTLAFSPDGRMIAVYGGAFSASADVQVWDLVSGDGTTLTPPQPIAALRWVDSTTLETVDIGGVLTRWGTDGQAIGEPVTLVDSTLPINAAFGVGRIGVSDCAVIDDTPDCNRSEINVFDSDGMLENTFLLEGLVRGFAFSSAGRLVATDGDTVYQWNVDTADQLNVVPQQQLTTITAIAVSEDGTRIALGGCGETETDANGLPSCTQGTVTIHAGGTLLEEAMIGDLNGEVRGLRFTPDSAEIGITTASDIAVYNVSGGAPASTYDSGSTNNSAITFAPGDSLLVVGDVNGFMYFWTR